MSAAPTAAEPPAPPVIDAAAGLVPLLRTPGPRILWSPDDEAAFAAARAGDSRGAPVGLRVLACAGRTLWVRPGSPDAEELARTFRWTAHVPPVPLDGAGVGSGGDGGGGGPVIIAAGCGAGYAVVDLLRRLASARVIGVDAVAALAGLARRNVGDLSGRCTIDHARVGVEDAAAAGGAAGEPPTVSLGTLVTRHARAVSPELPIGVDYVLVDLRSIDAGVLTGAAAAGPGGWLRRVGCVRARAAGREGAEAAAAALRAADMRAWVNDWGGPVATGVSRAFAPRLPRWPEPQSEIDPGPGFW